MVPVAGSLVSSPSVSVCFRPSQVISSRFSSVRLVSVPLGRTNLSLRRNFRQGRLQVCCAAKPETMNKVIEIVKNQLALPENSDVSGASTFSGLGADSLDTVEIVMGLEEEFKISVDEDAAQTITTVQEAADLIETLIEKGDA